MLGTKIFDEFKVLLNFFFPCCILAVLRVYVSVTVFQEQWRGARARDEEIIAPFDRWFCDNEELKLKMIRKFNDKGR